MIRGTKRRWLVVSVALGGLCIFFIGSKVGPPADAQAELQTAAEDRILVIPVQIERDSYGLAMVDTAGQTLWVYELNSRGPAQNRLKLLAARSWRYDRLLQQYNTSEPKPEQIKMLLEDLGEKLKEQDKEKQQGLNINVLKTAEPNKSGFSGQIRK